MQKLNPTLNGNTWSLNGERFVKRNNL